MVCVVVVQFLKGEFRNNLRSLSLHASSTEADALFDSWDEDGGGTLDMDELRHAIKQTAEKARRFHARGNPSLVRARALRARAVIADEAAECARLPAVTLAVECPLVAVWKPTRKLLQPSAPFPTPFVVLTPMPPLTHLRYTSGSRDRLSSPLHHRALVRSETLDEANRELIRQLEAAPQVRACL